MSTQQAVFVVDDDSATRRSVVALLKSNNIKYQVYTSAEEFLAAYVEDMRGCILTDLRLQGISGIEMQRKLSQRNSLLPVIILTAHGTVSTTIEAIQSGAITVLEKPSSDRELLEAIFKAHVREEQAIEMRSQQRAREARYGRLKEDEKQVLVGLLEGLANKQIAARLDIGLRTVELRRASIMKKLEVGSLPELVRFALEIQEGEQLAPFPQISDFRVQEKNPPEQKA